jgi:adenylate cyclase
LAGIDEIEIVAGVCQRLNSAGVALVRSSVATNLLDPTIGGRAVRWNRGERALEEAFPRTDDALTLAFMLRTTNRTARALITTYLGSDAAERVLAGNIVRGRAIPIRAVVWFSDLIGFARLSDTLSPDVVLALLNDYAEAQVEEIEVHGGHVLKFMGDGILAIFPDDDTTRACKRALV